MTTSSHRLSFALALFASMAGCDRAEDPLDPTLDPSANRVESSPTPFAPKEGGMGQGTFEDDLPFTHFVLTQGALNDVGESNCGQFSAAAGDLEVNLYGVLAPGTWTVGVTPAAGIAEVTFGSNDWNGGTVTIVEGSEDRGTTVRGRIDASTSGGEPLALTFAFLFHGCGRD